MKNLVHMTLISILLSPEKDILGLIWLSKIKNLCLFFVFSLLFSCHPKKNIENSREIVNYYSGVVLDEKNKEIVSGVSVTCLLDSALSRTVLTDKNGYFKISDPMLDTLNILKERKLIFEKEGFVSDTVKTFQYIPQYMQKNHPLNYYFVYKNPDTLVLIKKL